MASIKINKNIVRKYLYFEGHTVSSYCKKIGISRVRYYAILNRTYTSLNAPAIQRLAKDLGLKPEEIIL